MLELGIAIALLVAGLALFAKRLYDRRQAALPGGTAIASDTAEHPSPILISRRYGLKGRPDALLQTPAGVIPIERKHSRTPPPASRGRHYPSRRVLSIGRRDLWAHAALYAHPFPRHVV
jgi:hypothetical protein